LRCTLAACCNRDDARNLVVTRGILPVQALLQTRGSSKAAEDRSKLSNMADDEPCVHARGGAALAAQQRGVRGAAAD
jgi:hypothetical protein